MSVSDLRCNLCGSSRLEMIADVLRKPARETDFGIGQDSYRRFVYQCSNCSVYLNFQEMLGADIYTREYNQATYSQKLVDVFNRIRNLSDSQSDNKQRVRRVIEFNSRARRMPHNTRVLDIGSGLCVFLAELKDRGFYCHAIDPDPLSTQHALKYAKVDDAHTGTLDDFAVNQKFQIISLNKVLEHVLDPVDLLKKTQKFLAPGGFVYVELPDGEAALKNGNAVDREEFYIEHFTIFTPASFEYLVSSAGYTCGAVHQIHEPSDKYTLFGFLSN